jgi:heme-degrading monooxygenase HmoA
MHVVAWSYRILAGCEPAFEALYGSDGGWAHLFARSPAYLGTRLLRDVDDAACYATFDRWRSLADYEAFLREHREAYAVLDREGDALTCEETRLGAFETEPS